MYKIAFVAMSETYVSEIKKDIKLKKIKNIDVFYPGEEPDGYDIIEYGVLPNKKFAEVLDLGQCISRFGFPSDSYNPPDRKIFDEDNKKSLAKAMEHLSMENLEATLGEELSEITRAGYELKIQEIKSNKKKLSNMTTKEISAKMMFEEDPMVIIAMIAVLFDKIHNEPMADRWGNESRGYVSNKGKPVVDFVNPKSIEWISKDWSEKIPTVEPYYKNKYLKSLRTRGKNMLKEKSSIYGLKYFLEYLMDKDKDEISEILENKNENDEVTYKYEVDGKEFEIADDEIPFSLLFFIPLLSYSTYLEWHNIII